MWLNPNNTYIKQHDVKNTLEATRFCDKVSLCCFLAILRGACSGRTRRSSCAIKDAVWCRMKCNFLCTKVMSHTQGAHSSALCLTLLCLQFRCKSMSFGAHLQGLVFCRSSDH